MIGKLEDIDEILAGFEDWMHGEDGNKCTHARKIIGELKASNNAKLSVSGRSEQLPPLKDEVWAAADKYVFDDNGHKWSNNDDTAPDNFGSFKAGAEWVIQRLGGNCH